MWFLWSVFLCVLIHFMYIICDAPLCRIYCRKWTNVKILKFGPIPVGECPSLTVPNLLPNVKILKFTPILVGECPSLTVPNLLPNVDECENFEIHANSCWGRDESCTFFIWVRFFLDNSKIKIWHVRSQVDKVRLYLRMTTNECAK